MKDPDSESRLFYREVPMQVSIEVKPFRQQGLRRIYAENMLGSSRIHLILMVNSQKPLQEGLRWHAGTCLFSQNLESWGQRAVSLRPACTICVVQGQPEHHSKTLSQEGNEMNRRMKVAIRNSSAVQRSKYA